MVWSKIASPNIGLYFEASEVPRWFPTHRSSNYLLYIIIRGGLLASQMDFHTEEAGIGNEIGPVTQRKKKITIVIILIIASIIITVTVTVIITVAFHYF